MKIEKLSESSVKVTIYGDDMKKWNVSADTLLPKNPENNEMFWDIINETLKKTGIDFNNSRIVIEATQKAKDIFVMIISKKRNEDKRYKYIKKKKNIVAYVYTFSELEDVICFAKSNAYYCFLFDGKNSIFRDDRKIKLVVEMTDSLKEFIPAFNDRVCEYAQISKASHLYAAYLKEYNNPIIKNNALKTLFYKF